MALVSGNISLHHQGEGESAPLAHTPGMLLCPTAPTVVPLVSTFHPVVDIMVPSPGPPFRTEAFNFLDAGNIASGWF